MRIEQGPGEKLEDSVSSQLQYAVDQPINKPACRQAGQQINKY